jgi:hypothetical protein
LRSDIIGLVLKTNLSLATVSSYYIYKLYYYIYTSLLLKLEINGTLFVPVGWDEWMHDSINGTSQVKYQGKVHIPEGSSQGILRAPLLCLIEPQSKTYLFSVFVLNRFFLCPLTRISLLQFTMIHDVVKKMKEMFKLSD